MLNNWWLLIGVSDVVVSPAAATGGRYLFLYESWRELGEVLIRTVQCCEVRRDGAGSRPRGRHIEDF